MVSFNEDICIHIDFCSLLFNLLPYVIEIVVDIMVAIFFTIICAGAETNEVMAWHKRMKVAMGPARRLRYLHEDCRVGCIVHRDFRPSNILLAHDFEPMVSPF